MASDGAPLTPSHEKKKRRQSVLVLKIAKVSITKNLRAFVVTRASFPRLWIANFALVCFHFICFICYIYHEFHFFILVCSLSWCSSRTSSNGDYDCWIKVERRPLPGTTIATSTTMTAGCTATCIGGLTCDDIVLGHGSTCQRIEQALATCDCSGCRCPST